MRITDKDAEISLLRKQLETLKQELYCEYQLTQIYREELKDTKGELRCLENELSTVLTSEILGLEQAKELANSILTRKMYVSESLAKLLSGIYNSTIKSGELAQIDRRPNLKIKPARRSDRLTSGISKIRCGVPAKSL